jgi:hypothetical protein
MDNPNNQQKPNQTAQPAVKAPQQPQQQAQNKNQAKIQIPPKPVVAPAPKTLPPAKTQSPVMQIIAAFVVGILVGVIGVSIANKPGSPLYSSGTDSSSTPSAVLPSGSDTTASNTSATGIIGSDTMGVTGQSSSNGVLVNDQAAGVTVTLNEVDFQATGWVAIHEDSNGKPGEILGAALFPAGKTTDATVTLLRPTIAGTSYLAVLHFNDNPGSNVFNWQKDVIMDDSTGHPIMVQFTAQ